MSENGSEQAVLAQIQERTRAEPDGVQNAHGNLWTSNERMRSDAVKPHTEYTKKSLKKAVQNLSEAGEIVCWHGLLSPATDEQLKAIIENERQAEITRSTLVGECNRLRSVDTDLEEDDLHV